MNHQLEHLTDAHIDQYLSEGKGNTPDTSRQWMDAHLESCDDCRRRVLDAFPVHEGLRPNDHVSVRPYHYCPPEEILRDIAAGLTSREIAEHHIRHAADCDFCGPTLKGYLRDFSDEVAPEDAALLAEVQKSSAKRQKRMIRELTRQNASSAGQTNWLRLPALRPSLRLRWTAVAVATLVIALTVINGPQLLAAYNLYRANRLVASAYSQRRTIEMRFTSAPFADYSPLPSRKSSGAEDNLATEVEYGRPDLLEAKRVFAERLKSGKLDPRWLQVEARIALLEGTPESIRRAENLLNAAKGQGSDMPSLDIDLAISYFQSAVESDPDTPVLAKTIDLLTDVLKKDRKLSKEEHRVALFNLALAYEKDNSLDLAAIKWSEYLNLDANGEWAREAQDHLDKLKKASHGPKSKGSLEPFFFLGLPEKDRQADLEQYLDVALRNWLPVAVQDQLSDAYRASRQLADTLAEQNRDPFLRDLLNSTHSNDLPAVEATSAALNDNHNDFYERAKQESGFAAETFKKSKNQPGQLLAEFAKVYALQRSVAGKECLLLSEDTKNQLFRTDYYWLQGQIALERAVCANWTLNFEAADESVESSRRIAAEHSFPELGLRVIGINASMQRLRGKYDLAWREAVTGLGLYWQGSYSSERLYQFYSVMRQCAKNMQAPHAGEALLRHGIYIREQSAPEDIVMRARLYLTLAHNVAEDDPALANNLTNTALELVKSAPDKVTAHKYILDPQIEYAEGLISKGHPEAALNVIEPVHELLVDQDDFEQLGFYTVRGSARLQLHQFEGAIADYGYAVQVSERSLRNVPDPASRANWILKTDEIDRGLTRALLAQGEQKKALYVWERLRSRSLGGAASDSPPLADLKLRDATFDPQPPPVSDRRIIYAVFKDGLQIWTVDGPVVKGKWIEVKKEHLERIVLEFAKECAEKRPLDDGPEVYATLLGPVTAELPSAGPITVELDETLLSLPFEALRSPEGWYFGIRYSLDYSPGIFAEHTLRKPAPLATQEPFLLVNSSRLPGHTEESEAVIHSFPRTRLLNSSDVTPAQIMRAMHQSYGFHFSGHSAFTAKGTSLVLGRDSRLYAGDFTPEALGNVRIAVLSSCSSASAKQGMLDPSNLVRSFLVAGVPSVIASHWDVDSAGTADLMKILYFNLGKGDSPALALQKARKEMMASREHPYYWAGFTVTGRSN